MSRGGHTGRNGDPSAYPGDGFAQERVNGRQRSLLRTFLIGVLILLATNIVLALVLAGPEILNLRILGPSLVAAIGGLAALVVLQRGRLFGAGLLATTAFLVGDSWEFIRAGLFGQEVSLLMFLVPVLISGLLLRRRIVYSTVGIVLVVTVGVHTLELVTSGGQTVASTGALLLFTLVLILLSLFFDRFGIALRNALSEEALARSETARLYEQTRRLNESLEEKVTIRTAELESLNEELESFSYSVSHDLRAPLRSIDGFSRALMEDGRHELSEESLGYLERIGGAAQRMGEIIEDLLEFSHLNRMQISDDRIDLTATAREVFESLRSQEQGRTVDFEAEEGLTARGSRRLVRAILENLIGNGLKFTRGRDPAVIELGWSDEHSAFYVRDNGIGFDMSYADQLFRPFQRLHSPDEFEGTGIGLANVRRIVERHGGDVWARSVPGEGATFYFTLPDRVESEEPLARPDRPIPSPDAVQ